MKSYAGGKDDKMDGLQKDDAAKANEAAKKAEMKMEEIKEEARNEMTRQQKQYITVQNAFRFRRHSFYLP